MPTRSRIPASIAYRAVGTSAIFPACITGTFSFCLISPMSSKCGADAMPMIGIMRVKRASESMEPPSALITSTPPSIMSCATVNSSPGLRPFSRSSSKLIRALITKSSGTAARMALMTSSGYRIRFSCEPPNSSVRLFQNGVIKESR